MVLQGPLSGSRRNRGAALLIALVLILLVSVIAATSIETSRVEMNIAGNEVRRSQALWAAEAGLAKTEAVLRAFPTKSNADSLMALINAGSQLPNASFSVAMEAGLPQRKVISTGKGPQSEAAVQVLYHYGPNPYNIWNNVLFAGHGQNGMSIRGNTGIHGSVHILGDGEPYTDDNGNGQRDPGEPYTDTNHDGTFDAALGPGDMAISLTGTASISNNYLGLPAVLAGCLPSLPNISYGGEDVQTLFAELRVKHGTVVLDGDATAGQPNVQGGTPAIKETLDATWVNDGFSGSAATDGVHADNGHEESYDFNDEGPDMPDLDAPYVDSRGTSYTSYMNYLKANALVVPGDLNIRCGATLPPSSNAAGSLAMDRFGNLSGSGIIYVRGDITIEGRCPINYSGRFTLVSEGDTKVDTDFYPRGTFAVHDIAGVVSHGRLELGESASQLRLAGAFFAQEEVVTAKQTHLAGAVVSNFFNLTQVPNLYQVLQLARHLPPGMPGADDYYSYSWRRVPNSWTELY